MEKYDLCVIGGGPAGYAAAMRAIDFGKRVVLIEKDKIGGAGIYNGALSSKTLWELSEKVADVNETIVRPANTNAYEAIWPDVKQTVDEAIFERKYQYQCHIKLLQTETLRKLFTYERGAGKLVSPTEIEITKGDNIKVIQANYTVIATGGRPRKLPNIEVDEKIIMTSDGIHNLEDFPKSMVVLGAGVIGCEFATIFANFGRTKVYLIDRADRILPFEDEDIADVVADSLENRGAVIHHDAKLERMEIVEGEVEYEISKKDGSKEVIRVEKALLSVGRVPNIEGLGLEELGIKLGEHGVHIGDKDTQTNIPNIYAAGDVSGHIALVNMGEIEARHAVEKIFGNKKTKISYDNVCTIMFLRPEVAAVGLNEQQCIEQNIPVKVVKIDFSCIARAIAMRRTQGFFKIIVTNDEEMKILGMRAIGAHASSAIQGVALLIHTGKGIEELAELVHPHPSIIEGIQECVRMLLNKSIFKASVFEDKLKCYSLVDGIKNPIERL